MRTRTIGYEKVLEIPQEEAASKVVVAARNSLTSNLLADALVKNLNCGAVAIRPAEVLQTLDMGEVDLVIIGADFNSMPGAGFEMANAVSCAHPETPILLLLDAPSHDSVIRAFRCGACGVFNTQESMTDFIDCVEHVRKGTIWAGKEATSSLLEAFMKLPSPSAITEGGSPALTARELQVVQCAARGKTNKTIANELRLSEHTVKNYLFRAFEKLGVSSRVELLFYLAIRGHAFGPSSVERETLPNAG